MFVELELFLVRFDALVFDGMFVELELFLVWVDALVFDATFEELVVFLVLLNALADDLAFEELVVFLVWPSVCLTLLEMAIPCAKAWPAPSAMTAIGANIKFFIMLIFPPNI